jgi:hypothetical protein
MSEWQPMSEDFWKGIFFGTAGGYFIGCATVLIWMAVIRLLA